MYCSKCGSEVSENVRFCPDCGQELQLTTSSAVNEPVQQEATATSYQGFNATTPNQVSANYEQKPSFGWGVLGFFVPIAGLILYLIWKDEKPLTARLAGKGALISVIVSVVLWIIYFVIIAIVLGGSFAALSSY